MAGLQDPLSLPLKDTRLGGGGQGNGETTIYQRGLMHIDLMTHPGTEMLEWK